MPRKCIRFAYIILRAAGGRADEAGGSFRERATFKPYVDGLLDDGALDAAITTVQNEFLIPETIFVWARHLRFLLLYLFSRLFIAVA